MKEGDDSIPDAFILTAPSLYDWHGGVLMLRVRTESTVPPARGSYCHRELTDRSLRPARTHQAVTYTAALS